MSQRVITYQGSGTLNTWSEPSGLSSAISNGLTQAGYGVAGVQLFNVRSTGWAIVLGQALPTWTYQIYIGINATVDENPERVRTVLVDYLSNWFTGVDLSVRSDNIGNVNPNTGQTNYVSTNTFPAQAGILSDIETAIFGNDGTDHTTAKVLGVSAGTIFVIGLGFAAVYLLRASSPTRYVRRYVRG